MSVPLAYITVILIWSTTPLAIKWSSIGAGYLFGAAARMTIGAVAAWLLLRLLRTTLQWHRQARWSYVAASVGIYGSLLCVYWGSRFVPSGLISVMFGLTPLMVGLLAGPLLGERCFTPARIAGITLGFAGLWLIFHAGIATDHDAMAGIGAILLGVVLHALSTVWLKRIDAPLSALSMNSGALLLSALLFILTWLIADGQAPAHMDQRTILSIVYLGIIGSVLGFGLYFYTLRHLEASVIGLIPMITPVTALLVGKLFNHETVDASVWAGTALIIGGLFIYQWGHRLLARRAVAG